MHWWVYILNCLETYNGAITAVATFMIFIFTGALVIVSSRQAVIGKAAADAAKESADAAKIAAEAAKRSADALPIIERPYVFVETVSIYISSPIMYATPKIRNYGKTPAIIIGIRSQFMASNEKLPEQPAYQNDMKEYSIMLEAGQRWDDYKNQTSLKNPFYYGEIAYEDIFREQHATRFCFQIVDGSVQDRVGEAAYNNYD